MSALEVKNLSKSFGNIKAVDDVSFTIPEGSVFGLIGRNGAGKTTTIRMIMNIYLPDTGEVLLRGQKISHDFREKVGYLPEERGLYKKMKVLETLLFFAELKGKKGKELEKLAEMYLKKFQLYDRRLSKIEDLSKGNQQKIQFIATILHDPDFIILDEPFAGLDPVNTEILKDIIIDLRTKGKIIILSTHLMDFAERLCDNIVMIHKGKVILSGHLNDIKARYGKKNVIVSSENDLGFIKNLNYVESFHNNGSEKVIKLKSEGDSDLLLKAIVDNNLKINKFIAGDISLHDIFVLLAGNEQNNTKEESFHVQ